MKFGLSIFLGVFALMTMADAVVISKRVAYQHDGAAMEGFVAMPAGKGKHPGILVIQDWNGVDAHEMTVCKNLAALGYVAFAVDIYGKGIRPKTPADCGAEAKKYYDNPELYKDRIQAGLGQLSGFKETDPTRLGAVGYCFGGTGVLEMARNNMAVLGVVSFHGGLAPLTNDTRPIRPAALVLTGGADPMVPEDSVAKLKSEFEARKGNVRVVSYPGAGHAFTVKGSEKAGMKGVGYQAEADTKSWSEMKAFFAKLFAKK